MGDADLGLGCRMAAFAVSMTWQGRCTTLIKRNVVYHAYEKPLKERQTSEL